jgi:hypothetical protein
MPRLSSHGLLLLLREHGNMCSVVETSRGHLTVVASPAGAAGVVGVPAFRIGDEHGLLGVPAPSDFFRTAT